MSATAPAVSMGAPPRLNERLISTATPPMPMSRRECEADGEPLGSQEQNLRQRHEHRDCGHHDRGDAGRHALLGPEQEAVVEDEDQKREQEDRHPLAAIRQGLALRDHPSEENESRDKEAHCREEKRRNLMNANANREKRGSPDEVNDREGEQGLPRRAMNVVCQAGPSPGLGSVLMWRVTRSGGSEGRPRWRRPSGTA